MFSGVSSSSLWIFRFLHSSLRFSPVLHGSFQSSPRLFTVPDGSAVSEVLHGCVRVPVSKESLRFAQCRFGSTEGSWMFAKVR